MRLKIDDIDKLNNEERRVSISMYDGACSLSEISCDTSLPYKTVIHSLNSLRDKGCLVFEDNPASAVYNKSELGLDQANTTLSWSEA